MRAEAAYGKILVVDTNLFFVKRLTEALKMQGFGVVHATEPGYALTMIEWNMPVAILCAVNLHGSKGFDIPGIIGADSKTRHIPVIGIGDRGQQSQLLALRAGYDDFLDRRLSAEEISAHLVSFLTSYQDGFQPIQMLCRSETALDGRLSLVDLPGMIQVLAQARQSGALHINATGTDGVIFFDGGEVIHAESGQFAGDEAITHLIKCCHGVTDGVYKFIPGGTVSLRTVQGTISKLILDALGELDEAGSASTTLEESQHNPDADVPEPKLEGGERPHGDELVEPLPNPARPAESQQLRVDKKLGVGGELEVDREAECQTPPPSAVQHEPPAQKIDLMQELSRLECAPVPENLFAPEVTAGTPAAASEEPRPMVEGRPEAAGDQNIFRVPKELDFNPENEETNPMHALSNDSIEEAVGNIESNRRDSHA